MLTCMYGIISQLDHLSKYSISPSSIEMLLLTLLKRFWIAILEKYFRPGSSYCLSKVCSMTLNAGHCIYHFSGKVASYHVCQLLPSFTVSFTFSVFRKSHSYRLLTLASFFTDPARAGKVAYSAGWCTHKWL